jgi:hypothetical protein
MAESVLVDKCHIASHHFLQSRIQFLSMYMKVKSRRHKARRKDMCVCHKQEEIIHALSCLVLSCLVLSYLVLSCLVLSCLVLSCLVLSCLVLSCCLVNCHCRCRCRVSLPYMSCMSYIVIVIVIVIIIAIVHSHIHIAIVIASLPLCQYVIVSAIMALSSSCLVSSCLDILM